MALTVLSTKISPPSTRTCLWLPAGGLSQYHFASQAGCTAWTLQAITTLLLVTPTTAYTPAARTAAIARCLNCSLVAHAKHGKLHVDLLFPPLYADST